MDTGSSSRNCSFDGRRLDDPNHSPLLPLRAGNSASARLRDIRSATAPKDFPANLLTRSQLKINPSFDARSKHLLKNRGGVGAWERGSVSAAYCFRESSSSSSLSFSITQTW